MVAAGKRVLAGKYTRADLDGGGGSVAGGGSAAIGTRKNMAPGAGSTGSPASSTNMSRSREGAPSSGHPQVSAWVQAGRGRGRG